LRSARFGRPNGGWEDELKIDLTEVISEDGNLMELAEERVQCRALILGVYQHANKTKNFLFSSLTCVSRPAVGPTQPPVQWVTGGPFPAVKRCRGVTLTTHPHIMPRSVISRSCTSLPWRLHEVMV
jgi:hypothetical protein